MRSKTLIGAIFVFILLIAIGIAGYGIGHSKIRVVEINRTEMIEVPKIEILIVNQTIEKLVEKTCPTCTSCEEIDSNKKSTYTTSGAWKNASSPEPINKTTGTAWYHSMECTQYVGCTY